MSVLAPVLRIARPLVLVGLLLLSARVWNEWWTPAFGRLEPASLQRAWAALVAIAVAFLVVAMVAREGRQSRWLLAVEGAIAGLIGAVVPVWGMLLGVGPDAVPLPGVVQPLATALGTSPFASRMEGTGMGLATSWFVLVLALAWLVIVVHAVVRRLLDR